MPRNWNQLYQSSYIIHWKQKKVNPYIINCTQKSVILLVTSSILSLFIKISTLELKLRMEMQRSCLSTLIEGCASKISTDKLIACNKPHDF